MFFFLRAIFTFPTNLMITKWTASVEADPGFLHEVLEALRLYPDEDRDVNLVIDGESETLGQFQRKIYRIS